MARYTHIRNNFLLGEVSPTFWGRTDSDGYTKACEKLKNCFIRPIGGAYKRRGFRLANTAYLAETWLQSKDDIGTIKLIPFKGYTVIVGKSSGSSVLKYFQVTDQNLTYSPSDIAAFGGSAGTYGTDADLNISTIKYASYGDFLVLVDGVSNPVLIVDDGGTLKYVVWGFGGLDINASNGLKTLNTNIQHRLFPYITENVSTTTITASATTGTVTLTASTSIFQSTMVKSGAKHGVHVYIRSGTTYGVAEITAYTSGTVVTAVVKRTIADTSAHSTWAFSQFNAYFGFPTGVAFFQERLWFCGSASGVVETYQDYIFGSQLGDLFELSRENLSSTLVESDAFQIPATPNISTEALWLEVMSGRLFCGLGDQLTYLKETDTTAALSALNTTIKSANSVGSGDIQPTVVDNSIVYIDYYGRAREIVYNFEEDTFQSIDLSSLSEDLNITRALADYGTVYAGKTTFGAPAYSKNLKTFLAIDQFGSLYSCTRSRSQEVLAWAHHRLGKETTDDDEVKVLDVCINTDQASFGQEHFVIAARRTISGTDFTTIEIMEAVPHQRTSELWDAVYSEDSASGTVAFEAPMNWPIYMDCAILNPTTNGGGTQFDLGTSFGDTTLSVWAEGIYLGEVTTDASGLIAAADLDPADYDEDLPPVMLGFNYDAEIVPIALESNSLFGSGIGQTKRTEEIILVFNRTAHAEFGELEFEDDLQEIQFRESSVAASDPTPLFTGEKIFKLRSNYRQRQNIVIKSSKPYPMDVSCLVVKGILYD